MAAASSSLPDLLSAAEAWLSHDVDADSKAALQALIDAKDEAKLAQAFGERMSFGTAGLRGLMGVGPNNMNRLVIRQTTAGLAKHLLDGADGKAAQEKGVVIAYDGRHGSRQCESGGGIVMLLSSTL